MRIAVLVVVAACTKHDAAAITDGALAAEDAASDASIDAGPSDPFTTPVGAWTWVDVPAMQCGDGTPTGIGVNLSTTSDDVLVFFEGGGACWDLDSCFGINAAVHINPGGFDASTFQADLHYFPFVRTDPAPQLATPTYIYVPYCTGDLHAGNNVKVYDATHTVHHVGAVNTQAMIDRVHAALPNAQHVWVVGQSAGGYGATLNFNRFRTAYPNAELALLQDSSMFITVAANYGLWQSSWMLQYPPNCTNCDHDFRQVIATVTTAEPQSRIGLITYDNDTTIKLFFGYGLFDSIVAQVNSLSAMFYALPNTHVYEVMGADHTMLGNVNTNMALGAWVRQWASGDAAWANIGQ